MVEMDGRQRRGRLVLKMCGCCGIRNVDVGGRRRGGEDAVEAHVHGQRESVVEEDTGQR